MKRKRTIGLDVDGILFSWHEIIYDYIKYNKDIEDTYKEFWRKARDEDYYFDLLNDLVQVPMFYSQRNIRPHILNTVLELAKTNIIYYITARPEITKRVTYNWIKKSGLPYHNNVIITQNKRPHIAMLECDYFVDDSKHIIDSIKDITNAILFKHDTYTDEEVEGYNYIESLDELLEAEL